MHEISGGLTLVQAPTQRETCCQTGTDGMQPSLLSRGSGLRMPARGADRVTSVPFRGQLGASGIMTVDLRARDAAYRQPMSMAAGHSNMSVICVGGAASAAAPRRQSLIVPVGDGTRGGIAHVSRRQVVLGSVVMSRSLVGALARDIAVAVPRTTDPGTAARGGRVTAHVKC